MRKIISKNAFSLLELMIATLLVSVVLLGIFAVNNVLIGNNQDYGQRYLLRSETQTTLNHILNNAALASGSANSNDEAILVGAAVGDPNSFCIHQLGGNNLVNSANDIWLCYTLSNNQINWCAETYVPGTDPRGASSCSTATSLVSGTNVTFLGTAYSINNYNSTNQPPSLINAVFSMTIQNCYNNAATGCNSSGTSSALSTNPEVQISGSISASQVST